MVDFLSELLAEKFTANNSNELSDEDKQSILAQVFEKFDIIRLEANGNYTAFYLKDKTKYLITRTLKYYDEMLNDYGFYRIHKSHLVNLRYVTKFIKGRQGYVETINGDKLEIDFDHTGLKHVVSSFVKNAKDV